MNPYKILNLNNNCSKSEIRTAYKKLSLKFHPDKNLKKYQKHIKYYTTMIIERNMMKMEI